MAGGGHRAAGHTPGGEGAKDAGSHVSTGVRGEEPLTAGHAASPEGVRNMDAALDPPTQLGVTTKV